MDFTFQQQLIKSCCIMELAPLRTLLLRWEQNILWGLALQFTYPNGPMNLLRPPLQHKTFYMSFSLYLQHLASITFEQKKRILARIFHLSIFDSFQVDDDDDGSRATAMQPRLESDAATPHHGPFSQIVFRKDKKFEFLNAKTTPITATRCQECLPLIAQKLEGHFCFIFKHDF